MSGGRLVVYLLRRDLRIADNPVLHSLSVTGGRHGYTHLLPVYVLSPDQIELSGLVKDGESCPHPPSRAETSEYWKCGIHRVRFLAESVWDLKSKLEVLGSGLIIRAGSLPDVLKSIVQHYAGNKDGPQVAAVWSTKGFLLEEVREQEAVASFCGEVGIRFTQFRDHKWFIDNPEVFARSIFQLPNVFSDFQSQMGRVGDKARSALPPPAPFSLPPFPDRASLPAQHHPLEIPETLSELIEKLGKPVKPRDAIFRSFDFRGLVMVPIPSGGETLALQRLRCAIKKSSISQYHTTVEDLQVHDGGFNLSAYLSLGCFTPRQVHEELVRLEQGTESDWADALGFGEGETMGKKAVRAEMLHIDFIRLCNRKYGESVYSLEGCGPGRNPAIEWKTPNRLKARPNQVPCTLSIEGVLVQFQVGATGFGLIDAIMRQLLCTGHISLRAQMLAANFLGKFAGVDWRYGAELVSSLSKVHDTSLHWYLWQHHVGIGPDPSGGAVTFSPAHAAFEFDPDGSFVRKWMPELRQLTALPNLFEVATTSTELLQLRGLSRSVMVTKPVRSRAANCQQSSRRSCGGLHPQLIASRLPQGILTLAPYPKFLPVARPRLVVPIQNPSLFLCPPPPPGLPRPPPGFSYLSVPSCCGPSPQYFLAPHPLLVTLFRQTLSWFFQFLLSSINQFHPRPTRTTAEMTPLQDVEAPSLPGPTRQLPLPALNPPTAPNNAPSGPTIVNSASGALHDAAGGPTALTSTSRGPTIVVSDPRAVAAAATLREAHNSRAGIASAPRGPRADRVAEATHGAPRMRQVPQILQHPRTAQRPPDVAQDFRGASQEPPNAPRGPRADSRPSHARSNAPPNAPRAPRADYRPSQAPRNAPQAPRGQHWQYRTPQDDPQTHRAQNWQHQTRRNVAHGNFSTSQPPQNAFNAPQSAPRAPRAMQALPTAPHWTPQIAEPFVGATQPTTYPYSLYTSPPCPAFYGSYAFSRPATYQYMEEMPYYQVLQDYYQWHTSDANPGPWNVAPPDPDEVMRHGMILRFLDGLPPPPTNPEFPPDPPQLYRRTRRRRRNRTQSSRESGITDQTGSTEGTTAITRQVATTAAANASLPQATQSRLYRRGRRGQSGRHRQAAENNADGPEESGGSGASGEAVEVAGAAEAAEAVESGDLGDIVETDKNGEEGKDDESGDDRASAATCMW